jgi:hypothetical protein
MAVEVSRGAREGQVQVAGFKEGRVPEPGRYLRGHVASGDHGRGAFLQRLFYEKASVGLRAGRREEQRARPGLA